MPEEGDVYQLTLDGLYLGETVQNVFFYRIEDTPTDDAAIGLTNEFEEEVLPTLVAFQGTGVNYHRIHTVNLFDASDVYEDTIDVDGAADCGATAAQSPSFLAIHARLIRDNARVRNGAKYFPGLCEGSVDRNQIITLGTLFTTAAAKLIEPVVAGVVDTFKLVLVKRVRAVVPAPTTLNPDNVKYRYSLPTSQEQMGNLWAYVREVQFSLDVSHMDSRQQGHGA